MFINIIHQKLETLCRLKPGFNTGMHLLIQELSVARIHLHPALKDKLLFTSNLFWLPRSALEFWKGHTVPPSGSERVHNNFSARIYFLIFFLILHMIFYL